METLLIAGLGSMETLLVAGLLVLGIQVVVFGLSIKIYTEILKHRAIEDRHETP